MVISGDSGSYSAKPRGGRHWERAANCAAWPAFTFFNTGPLVGELEEFQLSLFILISH